MTSAKASRPSSAAAPATTASSRPCRPPRAVYAKGASEARHGFAGTRRTLGVWGPSRGPHLNSAEAERCLVVDAQGAEAHLAADDEVVERDVDDAAEHGHALDQSHGGDRVRGVARVTARRDPDHGERGDLAVAGERHRRPLPLAALRAQLTRRDGERAAAAALDPCERALARALEEGLQRDRLTHGRTGSPAPSPCCPRAYASVRCVRPRPVAARPRREAG